MTADGGVDADTLGRATWTFLHTLAATHPQRPTAAEQARMRRFMGDFAAVYPCAPCAASFRAIMARLPVDASSGPALALWMCRAHNEVNAELGKAAFDCARVGERWGVCESCAVHADALDEFKALMRGGARAAKKGAEVETGETSTLPDHKRSSR